jgi:hypothetical protein
VAARYLPGTAGAQVGGDWYGVIPIAPGCVGLAVGELAIAAPLARDAEGVCQALMQPQEVGVRRGDDVAILAVQRRHPPPA